MRGLKRHWSARILTAGQAFVQNLRRGHYDTAHPHQAIGQRTPCNQNHALCTAPTSLDTEHGRRKPILNGLINEYMRAA